MCLNGYSARSKGAEYRLKAMAKDRAGEITEAFALYKEALEFLMAYHKAAGQRGAVTEGDVLNAIAEMMARAEQLKLKQKGGS